MGINEKKCNKYVFSDEDQEFIKKSIDTKITLKKKIAEHFGYNHKIIAAEANRLGPKPNAGSRSFTKEQRLEVDNGFKSKILFLLPRQRGILLLAILIYEI